VRIASVPAPVLRALVVVWLVRARGVRVFGFGVSSSQALSSAGLYRMLVVSMVVTTAPYLWLVEPGEAQHPAEVCRKSPVAGPAVLLLGESLDRGLKPGGEVLKGRAGLCGV
jgi:hypothetical protein